MKFIYLPLHKFNQSKPICEVNDVLVQWDECDLSNLPPLIEPGTASMISHGKFSKYNEEDLPTTFMDTKLIIGDGWIFIAVGLYIIYKYIKSVMEYDDD